MVPEPTLEMSASANEARIASTNSTMTIEPTVDFDRRRKEASIEVFASIRWIAAALGAGGASIKAAAFAARPRWLVPPRMRKLVAGNWKMHGVAADLEQVRAIAEAS